jgi:hypothetical protein
MQLEITMAKSDDPGRTDRSKRMKLSPEETLKRMEEFPKRRAAFIAAIRRAKSRRSPRRGKTS